MRHRGMTLQVQVGDVARGREFYAALFGRGPDFAPHEDFLEWQVVGVPVGLWVYPTPVTTLPGVVSFVDVEDPWANRLGYYEDIVPSGDQREPGGSVHDASLFESDR